MIPHDPSTRDLALICLVAIPASLILRPAWLAVTLPVRVGLWLTDGRDR